MVATIPRHFLHVRSVAVALLQDRVVSAEAAVASEAVDEEASATEVVSEEVVAVAAVAMAVAEGAV